MIEKIYEKMRWTEIVFVGNNQYINKFDILTNFILS